MGEEIPKEPPSAPPGTPCPFCPPDTTPSIVRITFSGVVTTDACMYGYRRGHDIGENFFSYYLLQTYDCSWWLNIYPTDEGGIYQYPGFNCEGDPTYYPIYRKQPSVIYTDVNEIRVRYQILTGVQSPVVFDGFATPTPGTCVNAVVENTYEGFCSGGSAIVEGIF